MKKPEVSPSKSALPYNSFIHAPAGFAVVTKHNHLFEFANPAFEKIMNRKISIDKSVRELFPEIEHQHFWQILDNTFTAGEPFIANEFSINLQKQEDHVLETHYLNIVVQPLKDEDGNTEKIMLNVIDVTAEVEARRQIKVSEDKELFIRTVLESSPDCLKVLDKEGRIKFMNFNGLCQMEIDDFSEFKYKSWWTLWGSENEELVKASIDKALKGETVHFTALCNTAKGNPKWWDVMVSPVGNPNEPVQQIISISRDVTEQKKSEEALYKINQTLDLKNIELETANSELKSFSYMASHDLQEPLRMIRLFSERIIETEKFSEKTQTHFNHIISASKRMQHLINSLIDYSRIDETKTQNVKCDLNQIIEEAKNDLQFSIAEKQAMIDYEKLPIIQGVHIQLSQLFTNLISNAIKYSQPKITPHIKITAARLQGVQIDYLAVNKQLDYYAIKIEDNGIGFDKKYASKIFEAFQRLHNKSEYEGTGIGLSIVQKIAAKHHGFITADSNLGIGSTFTVYLPTSLN